MGSRSSPNRLTVSPQPPPPNRPGRHQKLAIAQAVTRWGFCRLQFSEGSPAKSDEWRPCWLLSLCGPFAMRRCRRHRRSMGFFDRLPIMTLGGGLSWKGGGLSTALILRRNFFCFGRKPRFKPPNGQGEIGIRTHGVHVLGPDGGTSGPDCSSSFGLDERNRSTNFGSLCWSANTSS